ncbi:MAG: hypothetical protein LBH24_02205, partial [Clostridiales bacterium]|nr:hypothetical protein [Clostridiales bacterium]
MNRHNSFTLTAGGETVTAYNRMLDVSAALAGGKPFAAYIALGAADAVKAVLPTALAFFNADPLAGGLYAVFE